MNHTEQEKKQQANKPGAAKRAAFLGLFLALAMILGRVEALLPVFPFAPGIKIGLANMVTVFVLVRFGWKEAAVVGFLRVFAVNLLFGTLPMMLYGAAGAALSLLVMALLKKTDRFGIPGISIAGGICHNLGQFLVAVLLLRQSVLVYYLPILCLAGTLAGAAVGAVTALIYKKTERVWGEL